MRREKKAEALAVAPPRHQPASRPSVSPMAPATAAAHEGIADSPRLVAQARQVDRLFGPAQRRGNGAPGSPTAAGAGTVQRLINILPGPNDPPLPPQRLTPANAELAISASFDLADRPLMRNALAAFAQAEGYWQTTAQLIAYIQNQIQPTSQGEIQTVQQILPQANAQTITVARLALQAGLPQGELQWVAQAGQSNADIYYLVAAMLREFPVTGGTTIVRTVLQQGTTNRAIHDVVTACLPLCAAQLSPVQVIAILGRYLTAQSADRIVTIMNRLRGFDGLQCQRIAGMLGSFPANAFQFNNLLDKAFLVAPPATGIDALVHCHGIYNASSTLLEMLEHAPAVPFADLQWVASAARPCGDDAQTRASCGRFIHGYANQHREVAKWLIADMPALAQHGAAAHGYITNQGQINDATTLHQRFVALRAGNWNSVTANQGLAAQFTLQQAQALVQGSGAEMNHVANDAHGARYSAQWRGAGNNAQGGITGNSCIVSGSAGLAAQLFRVMTHFRAAIGLLANGDNTPLMTLAVDVNENLWYRLGQPGTPPQARAWGTLEVVIGRDNHGRLFLRHGQPNPA